MIRDCKLNGIRHDHPVSPTVVLNLNTEPGETPLAARTRSSHVEEAPLTGASGVDLDAAADAVRAMLIALGEDPQREGLRDTPSRVARAMAEMMRGRFEAPDAILGRTFEQVCDEPVILRDIRINSLCEHHLLPFEGRAHVAYLPANGRVVGLSKLARLVDLFARRPQLQERLTREVADALEHHLEVAAVAVIIEAEHSCMKLRGVCKHEACMQTMALRGHYKTDTAARSEILAMLRPGR